MDTAYFGVGQVQLLARTRDADIREPALFLEAAIVDRTLVREQAILHADEKHHRKLQSLRRMQGHQLHAVFAEAGLTLAGFERGVREERVDRVEALVLGRALEAARRVDQFVEIFQTRFGLLTLFLLVVLAQAGAFDHPLHHLRQRLIFRLGREAVDQIDKNFQAAGAAAELCCCIRRRLPQRYAALARQRAQALDRRRADAARRRVDGALEAGIVIANRDEAQIRERVLDLHALEEAQAAVDAVRQAVADQRLFEHARLRIRAIQDRAVAQPASSRVMRLDPVDDELGLVVLVERRVELDRLALLIVGPEVLAEPPGVLRNQSVRGLEDRAGRAIVLFEADDFGAWKIMAELDHVLDLGAAPAVDRLVVITDHEHRAAVAGQRAQPGVLQRVGVLELVDQDVAEAVAVVRLDVAVVAAQLVSAQQQFGEIDQPARCALRFVRAVDAHEVALREIAHVHHRRRAPSFLFLRIDPAGDLLRHPLLFGKIEAADHALDQTYLIVGVENLEVLRQARVLPVQPQHAMRDAVKGADPHRPHRHAHEALDAPAHLGRRLVGERHRKNRMRRDVLDFDQPGDAVREHARLAGTGTGQHQAMLGRRGDGVALRGVEDGNEFGDRVGRMHPRSLPGTARQSAARRAIRRRMRKCSSSTPLENAIAT